ncbi:MAG: HEAT repeat domain-containing protein [Thermoguttaceae bacterium]
MTATTALRWFLTLACCAAMASHAAAGAVNATMPKFEATAVSWLSNLNEASRQSLATRKPIFVVVKAQWCGSCRQMAGELDTAAVQAELARWTAVRLDIEAQADDAGSLGVVGVPTLRILAPGGRQTAEYDGYLAPDRLVRWLQQNYDAATAMVDESLLASGEPSVVSVARLIKQFGQRNPALREAAARRLAAYPDVARPMVIKAFCEGSLTARLTALEVLEQWKAPLADLDPWRPDSFTPERVARLDRWRGARRTTTATAAKSWSPEELADAKRQIDRMLQAGESESDAIRQRLAVFGESLLPEVYARLKKAAADQERRRLLILRYRLAASDSLVLRWPGGLERLGDADPRQRRRAADELAKLADSGEKSLLLELFADTDPLVREISLRGLQHIGGPEANAALVKLLRDPEPNVRAAVLKQLEESPDPLMASDVVKYLQEEKDPDLIVHGIFFLREIKSEEATKCLMALLKHESWQVRAEAAVGIGKQNSNRHDFNSFRGSSSSSSDKAMELQVQAYVALLDLLNDKDAFVVAKAVEGLDDADLAVAVEPLVKAAEKYPDLAASILSMLAGKGNMRDKAIPYFRKFCKHAQSRVRAAAVTALVSASPLTADEEIVAALNDKDREVRIAAAKAGFSFLDQMRREAKAKVRQSSASPSVAVDVTPTWLPSNIISNAVTLVGKMFDAAPTNAKGDATKSVKSGGDKKPAAEAKPDANDPDAWIKECYAGRHRPRWTAQMAPPLEKMLHAETAAERIAAARALTPLGKVDEAIPVLIAAARESSELAATASNVLPWLCVEQRITTLRALRSIASTPESRSRLASEFGEESDRRFAALMWEMLAEPGLSAGEAASLQMGLLKAYLGDRYYSPDNVSPSDRRELAQAAKLHATSGGNRQRRVAMALLAMAAADEAVQLASKWADDPKLDKSLRNDAFQISLAVGSTSEARKLATAAIRGANDARKKLAVKYFTHGPKGLQLLGDGIYLQGTIVVTSHSVQGGMPIVPEAPAGVTAADVRPLLGSSDRETAACAAYLLTLLGESDAIEPLLQYWRRNEAGSDPWRRLVYRAIAVLDDPKYIGVLREIYAKLDGYEVSEFYWTIRIMSGPEILKFRKQIRSERGEQLR